MRDDLLVDALLRGTTHGHLTSTAPRTKEVNKFTGSLGLKGASTPYRLRDRTEAADKDEASPFTSTATAAGLMSNVEAAGVSDGSMLKMARSSAHVYLFDDEEYAVTPEDHEAIVALFNKLAVPKVARRYQLPVEVVMDIWNAYRRRHGILAILI